MAPEPNTSHQGVGLLDIPGTDLKPVLKNLPRKYWLTNIGKERVGKRM